MASSLTPEALVYGLKTAGDPGVSPDGSQIVYTLSQANPETNKVETQLWLCDIDGGNQRQLTHQRQEQYGTALVAGRFRDRLCLGPHRG